MQHQAFTEGKTAVITGAALGIGRAAALRFAEMGLKVCLVDLPSADLEEAEEAVAAKSSTPGSVISVFPILKRYNLWRPPCGRHSAAWTFC